MKSKNDRLSRDEYRLKNAATDWLKDDRYNAYITVTLKQAIPNTFGGLKSISRDDARKTAWIMRDRLSNKLLTHSENRNRDKSGFLAFLEGEKDVKRYHLHIVSCRPDHVSENDYSNVVRCVCEKLEWTRKIIDIRPITESSKQEIGYSLKDGLESFIPESSSVWN